MAQIEYKSLDIGQYKEKNQLVILLVYHLE